MSRADYQERRESKIELYEERSNNAEHKSDQHYKQANKLGSVIPFGQPILVGHHSEKRDRNHRARMNNQYDKSFEESKKAKYYASKAEGLKNNRVISSDDPEATQKLAEKIAKAEKRQVFMKAVNRIVKSKPKNEKTDQKLDKLEKLDLSRLTAEQLFLTDFCGRVGFASYELTNNNANINRMKKRLATLKQAENAVTTEQEYDGFTITENAEANRVQIDFHSKEDYIKLCKNKGINLRSHGFKFSKYDGNVWQRQLNNAGRYAAEKLASLMLEKINQSLAQR